MVPILIIGCGYIGQRVAALEQARGSRVLALARSAERARVLQAINIETVSGDLDAPDSMALPPLDDAIVYYFAPPPPAGAQDTRLRAFLPLIKPPHLPRRVVLISTTGVYGDCQGAWVTEQTPAKPQADRAIRRLDAETALRDWAQTQNVSVVLLRVPGIYGPGKLPIARLQRGEPVLREQDAPFSNRVHAQDLARACVAAAHHEQPLALYNISDGHPSTMTDYFYRVADALGLARPPAISLAQAKAQMSVGMLSYLAESKRLDNRLMREHLGVHPEFPDLASGLPSCITDESK